MTNVGAVIGMGLSTMYPAGEGSGMNQMARTAIGAVAGNMALSIVGKLPKPDHLIRYLFPKPNAVMISQYGPIFRKLEHFIINKYLEQIRSCELQPRNGEINLSLNELQLHKPLMDKFECKDGTEKEVLLTLIDGRNDPGQTASSWKSLFWNFESLVSPASGGSGVSEDNDLGKVILVSSWKMNVSELKDYITAISEYNASALITKMFCAIEKDKNRKKGGKNGGGEEVDIILDWEEIHVKSNKRMSNTIVSREVQTELFDDVKWFMGAESWYNDKGLPYKRGYLLSGPPGTGKTSLLKAIASEYKMKVFIIDLEIVKTNSQFSSLMKKINYLCKNQPYILALEDVDRCSLFDPYQNGRMGLRDKNILSMNCFLNEIDGLVETHGRLLFLTANKPEEMTTVKALMRPGRIDKQITVDHCDFDQIQRLLLHFFGLEWECLMKLDKNKMKSRKITPAEVIAVLQGSMNVDPKTILHHFFEGYDEFKSGEIKMLSSVEQQKEKKHEETELLLQDSLWKKNGRLMYRKQRQLKIAKSRKKRLDRNLKKIQNGSYLSQLEKSINSEMKKINTCENTIKMYQTRMDKRKNVILKKSLPKKGSSGKQKQKRKRVESVDPDPDYVPPMTRRRR